MKNIDEIYKEWRGESHLSNSAHPVHDSAEAQDFAEYYHKCMLEKLNGKDLAGEKSGCIGNACVYFGYQCNINEMHKDCFRLKPD